MVAEVMALAAGGLAAEKHGPELRTGRLLLILRGLCTELHAKKALLLPVAPWHQRHLFGTG